MWETDPNSSHDLLKSFLTAADRKKSYQTYWNVAWEDSSDVISEAELENELRMNSGSGHEGNVSSCKCVSGHVDVCGCGDDEASPMSELYKKNDPGNHSNTKTP